MHASPLPPMVSGLSAVADRYDVLLCDVWGVVIDGITAHLSACDALARFRAAGGTVVLVSNAPRPGDVVHAQLAEFGVPDGICDALVASGDVTRTVLEARPGLRVFHIGPNRDLPLFDGLDVQRVPLDQADLVLCTNLRDEDVETAEDYRPLLDDILKRRLTLVCGNPDVVVERGDRLVYCAGAIADLYAEIGGETIYAGKPHAPIYQLALARAAALRRVAAVDKTRVLAIGDSVRTDLTGAAGQGLDCLFVLGGIHAGELGDAEHVEPLAVAELFRRAPAMPVAVMSQLAW